MFACWMVCWICMDELICRLQRTPSEEIWAWQLKIDIRIGLSNIVCPVAMWKWLPRIGWGLIWDNGGYSQLKEWWIWMWNFGRNGRLPNRMDVYILLMLHARIRKAHHVRHLWFCGHVGSGRKLKLIATTLVQLMRSHFLWLEMTLNRTHFDSAGGVSHSFLNL